MSYVVGKPRLLPYPLLVGRGNSHYVVSIV